MNDKTETVAVVGLGYVGLPLAVAFGCRRPSIGLDLNEEKLAHYRAGRDPSGEVEGFYSWPEEIQFQRLQESIRRMIDESEGAGKDA